MPNLKIELKRKQAVNTLATSVQVTATLDINFSRRSVLDEQISIPITHYNTKTNIVFPNFNGGKATLKINAGNVDEKTFIFYIRGINPTVAAIRAYVGRNNGPWFYNYIIQQESTNHQFNIGTPSPTGLAGTPNRSHDETGWGLGQIDSGSNDITRDILWNWKSNLDHGIAFINNEKKGIAVIGINRINNLINDWDNINLERNINADDVVSNYDVHNYSFSHVNSSEFTNTWVSEYELTGNSLMDAMWIKAYNGVSSPGNASGQYYSVTNQSGIGLDGLSLKPLFQVNNLNNHSHDYVNSVLGHN